MGKTRVAAAIARALIGRGPAGRRAQAGGDRGDAARRGWRCDDAERLIEAIGGGCRVDRGRARSSSRSRWPRPSRARRAGPPLDTASVERAVADALDLVGRAGRGDGRRGGRRPALPARRGDDRGRPRRRARLPARGRRPARARDAEPHAPDGRGRAVAALRVAGVVLNGAEPTADPVAEATNADELARRLGRVPILAELCRRRPQACRRRVASWMDLTGIIGRPAAARPARRPDSRSPAMSSSDGTIPSDGDRPTPRPAPSGIPRRPAADGPDARPGAAVPPSEQMQRRVDAGPRPPRPSTPTPPTCAPDPILRRPPARRRRSPDRSVRHGRKPASRPPSAGSVDPIARSARR